MLFPSLAFLTPGRGASSPCDCRDNPLHTVSFSSHRTPLKHLNCNAFPFKVWGIQPALVFIKFYSESPKFGVFLISISPTVLWSPCACRWDLVLMGTLESHLLSFSTLVGVQISATTNKNENYNQGKNVALALERPKWFMTSRHSKETNTLKGLCELSPHSHLLCPLLITSFTTGKVF